MNPEPKIKCRHCDGCGMVGLSWELLGTYRLLELTPDTNAAEMADLCNCSVSAMHNQLATLCRLGLAERKTKTGKQWSWVALKQEDPK